MASSMLRAGAGLVALTTLSLNLGGCVATAPDPIPGRSAPATVNAADEDAHIAALLSRMSLERKVAQLIQPQINSVTPAEMREYRWGSYLNGGNGGPYGNEFAPAGEWLRLADEMWEASTAPLPGGEPVIPTMWGTDAVHGHTNVPGATIFPHNIALGATGDSDLVRRIGAATALEIEATGIDWNFSPTVAVARDDRWGRTYESYGEQPELAGRLGAALIEGLQGRPGEAGHLREGRVIATAKHFFGDGGTRNGVDQGDVDGDLTALKAIHAAPYIPAIAADVQTIMASFNSVNGIKMHGNRPLLTDFLRGELGFTGVVVGDWNAHGQIPGCTVSNCPQALLAGLDIYMVPDDAVALHRNLVAQVRDGTVPIARIDEAVARVLRLKLRAGLLDADARKPSQRQNGGKLALLGAPAHRALAREAVARSQVVLSNDGVLPLRPGAKVLVAGSAADSVAMAAGGWTLTWQGGRELGNERFPGATSIYAGIAAQARAGGGLATLAPDGRFTAKPDVALVVFGEEPYAEFSGDRKHLALTDEEGLTLLRRFKNAGIPVVAVLLSGRPLWMNRELNTADAFVASWLPGSEGAGVADVLYGVQPARGRLSFSWPIRCEGEPPNGLAGALFEVGYGRALDDIRPLARLDETCAFLGTQAGATWFANGRLAEGVSAAAGATALPGLRGGANGVSARGLDKDRQEDARRITLAAGATLHLSGGGAGGWRVAYSLANAPTGSVTIGSGAARFDATRDFQLAAGKGWREMVLTAQCLPGARSELTISASGPLEIDIARVERIALPEGTPCSI